MYIFIYREKNSLFFLILFFFFSRIASPENKLHSRREFYSLSIYSEYKIKKRKSFARLVGSTCPSSPPLNLHDAPQYYVDTHTYTHTHRQTHTRTRMNKYDVTIVKNESNKKRYERRRTAHTNTTSDVLS